MRKNLSNLFDFLLLKKLIKTFNTKCFVRKTFIPFKINNIYEVVIYELIYTERINSTGRS